MGRGINLTSKNKAVANWIKSIYNQIKRFYWYKDWDIAYFWPDLFKQFICHVCVLSFNNLSALCFCSIIYDISEELDLSHFIGSDETAAPQHLGVF